MKQYTTQWVPTPTTGTSTDCGTFFGSIVHEARNIVGDAWIVRLYKTDGIRYASVDYEEFDDELRAEAWLEGVLWTLERNL